MNSGIRSSRRNLSVRPLFFPGQFLLPAIFLQLPWDRLFLRHEVLLSLKGCQDIIHIGLCDSTRIVFPKTDQHISGLFLFFYNSGINIFIAAFLYGIVNKGDGILRKTIPASVQVFTAASICLMEIGSFLFSCSARIPMISERSFLYFLHDLSFMAIRYSAPRFPRY